MKNNLLILLSTCTIITINAHDFNPQDIGDGQDVRGLEVIISSRLGDPQGAFTLSPSQAAELRVGLSRPSFLRRGKAFTQGTNDALFIAIAQSHQND